MPLSPSPADMLEANVDNSKAQESRSVDESTAPTSLAIVPAAAEAPCLALVPFGRKRGKPTAKAAHFRKAIQENLKVKTPDEFKAELLAQVEASEQSIAKVTDVEKARDAEVQAAQDAYDAAQANTSESHGAHLAAARKFKEAVQKRILWRKNIDQCGDKLLEASKKVAMLQVLKENQVTMRRLKEQKELAVQAAREAKQSLLECRQLGKRSLATAAKQAKKSSHGTDAEVTGDTVVGTAEKRPRTDENEASTPTVTIAATLVSEALEAKDVPVTGDTPVGTAEPRPRTDENEPSAPTVTIAATLVSEALEAKDVPAAMDEKCTHTGCEAPAPMAVAAAGGA